MRRSRNTDRGNDRGRQNMSPRPLISNHLKNIDLELELLKRKREMFEQQHSIFQPFNKQPQRNYNQQAYTYNENVGQGSSNSDFSYLYDDGRQQNRKPFPKKRPSDSNFQHDSYPKRSAGRGRGYAGPPVQSQKSFPSANQPKRGYSNKPGRGKPSIAHRTVNQKPQIPEKNFVPNKVTKPSKSLAPPNKIASQPIAERNRLVAATMQSVAETNIPSREEFRLHPDQEPTKQMRGRMEMSLGAILNDVREVYANSPYVVTLGTVPLQRIIKQSIRDRIRTAMLGKIVGTIKEIVKEYRDMFPKETDRDIVDEAIKAVRLDSVEYSVDSVANKKLELLLRPDDILKENIVRLLNSHLNEMFNKMEAIYSEPTEKEGKGDDVEIMLSESSDGDNNGIKPKNNENNDTKMNEDEAKREESDKLHADVKNKEDIAKKEEEYTAIKAAGDAAAVELGLVNQTPYKKMLPRLIKKHIPTIVKMLNINKMYREAVGDLIAAARAKYLESQENLNTEDSQQSDSTVVRVVNSTPKKQYPLPYYVKMMGKPQLPKKNALQPFLEEFNPKSVKKHRTIHNLLFIGFTEKSDFDAMVQANGTVIGRYTLSIRVCENTNEKQENKSGENEEASNSNPEVPNQKSQDLNASSEDILGADLNGQIDELLNSLKEGEDNLLENTKHSCLENRNVENLPEVGHEVPTELGDDSIYINEKDSHPEVNSDVITNEALLLSEKAPTNELQSLDSGSNNIIAEKKVQEIDSSSDNLKIKNMEQGIDSGTINSQIEKEKQVIDSGSNNPQIENKEQGIDSGSNNPQIENKEQGIDSGSNDSKAGNKSDIVEIKNEKTDKVSELVSVGGRSTPTRASARLANVTPSSIKTRRASRLTQN